MSKEAIALLSKGFVLLSLSDKVLQQQWPGSHELCSLPSNGLVVDLRIQGCTYWGACCSSRYCSKPWPLEKCPVLSFANI